MRSSLLDKLCALGRDSPCDAAFVCRAARAKSASAVNAGVTATALVKMLLVGGGHNPSG
jgi:hypothetical protein